MTGRPSTAAAIHWERGDGGRSSLPLLSCAYLSLRDCENPGSFWPSARGHMKPLKKEFALQSTSRGTGDICDTHGSVVFEPAAHSLSSHENWPQSR